MADPKNVQTQVRLPVELHKQLSERAASHDVSLNETIVRALRFALVQAEVVSARGDKRAAALKVTTTEHTTRKVEVQVL